MLLQNLPTSSRWRLRVGVHRKLTQSDNQVRAAIAAALGDFKGDEGAFSTETNLPDWWIPCLPDHQISP